MLTDTNVLLTLAIILVVGTVFGHLSKLVNLPTVTGKILAGILMGASVIGLFPEDSFHALDPVMDFALGLMAVAVGSHLNFRRLRVARRRLLMLVFLEATLTPAFIYFALTTLTDASWFTALLLATIAISTAPATVLALVKETGSKGAFVTTIIAAVALNNLACIVLVDVSRTLAHAQLLHEEITFSVLLAPFGTILLSLLLGFSVGAGLIFATRHVHRTDRLFVMSFIAILLTTGLTAYLDLSVLLACLSLGVTLANLTPDKDEIGHKVFETFETGIYTVFFTVAGMELDFHSLAIGGVMAIIVFSGRLAGKVSAGYLGMRLAGATSRHRRWVGLSLVPQAGLAVGLMLLVTEDPTFAPIREVFLAVVLATVLMNETVGPILTKMGLARSGDFGKDRARVLDFISEHNITTELVGPDKATAIRQLVDLVSRTHSIPVDADTLFKAVMEGEERSTTCLGEGLALPHARLDVGNKIIGAMGICSEGLSLDAIDGRPVHCMVLVFTPTSMPDRHLEVLKALASSIGHDKAIQQQLYHIDSPGHADELIHIGDQFEDWNYYLDEAE